MSDHVTPRQRRRPTRWVLVAAVSILAVVLVGSELLLRTKPVHDTQPFVVSDLPPIGIEADPGLCRRGSAAETIDTIGTAMAGGGRITSTHVYSCPQAFDGLRVTYVGEAVGELIPRDGGAWVQVNDDDYALEVGPIGRHQEHRGFNPGLAVWLPDGLHEQIEGAGRPGRRGDVILVEGVLRRTDPADGGGTTLRADRLEIVSPTVAVREPVHGLQAVVAGLLGTAALTVLIWSRRVRRR